MGLLDMYHYLNTEVADERTNNWTFVSSPTLVIVLTIMYLYFILVYGPKYMQNKQAYNLKQGIRIFNIAQIVSNALITYHILEAGWYEVCSIYCVQVDYSTSPRAMKFARIMWYLIILKLSDYIETCMYVLRKKNKQVSFLHVYHHISTVVINWIILKYFSINMSLTVPLVNCSIHVIMYTYYLLTSLGPEIQKFLEPFKPLLTITQMAQFIFLIIYSLQAFIPGCPGTKIPAGIMILNLIINFYLFYDFYRKSYVLKKSKKV
ncbi:very long chain fatty acid elongase AAEL008004-like [Ptiloglossa arizonensis]|uniref:very long chain fatty acid elongase AAEL008004-like n=1 Tax=Ptiloglossa arizonensis TaxID=3350558 RepID=UPI003FA01734